MGFTLEKDTKRDCCDLKVAFCQVNIYSLGSGSTLHHSPDSPPVNF